MAAQHADEDRVVPVHRPAVLVEEALGPVRDRDGERTERQLPVGTFAAEPFRGGDRAAQRRVDARRSGEQRALAVDAGGVGVPLDLAGRVLVVEREVDRALDDREHRLEEAGVARAQVVVPHAVRDVAA